MFIDKVQVRLNAGNGGNGIIAWRRLKYLPKGGPAGGDGGKGGSIFLHATSDLYSLESFRNFSIIQAEHGSDGGQAGRQGKKGDTLVLRVPVGTQVRNFRTKELIIDLTEDRQRIEICHGGRGGFGNVHFKSPTNRAPYECTKGAPGETIEIELELKLIADAGFVGLPNAGKSTLFSGLTPYHVKIGNYPFTTLKPNLSYIEYDDYSRLFLADIPGIIKDAHQGRGLGLEFLKHIERSSMLVFVLDAAPVVANQNPIDDFLLLQNELRAYDPALLNKPMFVILNKNDLPESKEHIEAFYDRFPALRDFIFSVSAATATGFAPFIEALRLTKAQNLLAHA
ncbi:MAG: GTPase ObgE [Verrucomicrobia bacterium]|nr:GTPase ObgE [Verrucomicrobiota bacterium]